MKGFVIALVPVAASVLARDHQPSHKRESAVVELELAPKTLQGVNH